MPKKQCGAYFRAASYLTKLIGPHRKWYFVSSSLALVSAGMGILNAKATQWLIDSVAAARIGAAVRTAALFAFIIAANALIARVGGISTARLAAGASRDMKRSVAAALVYADYRQLVRLKAGDAISTVNSDTGVVCDFLSGDFLGLLSQASMALGAITYLMSTSPLATLVAFAYTPVGMCFALALNARMQKLYPVRADRAGQALSVVEQALMQIPVIKSFLMEKRMRQRVESSCGAVLETEMKIARSDAPLQTACASIANIPRMLFLLFAGALVIRGEMTLGAFIAAFDLLFFIIVPSVHFPFMLNGLNRSVASIDRIARLQEMPAGNDGGHIRRAPDEPPRIDIEGLSFGYEEGKPIVQNLDFAWSGPGIIAIGGQSGRGKTTLIDLIAGLLTPDAGSVRLGGDVSVMAQDSFLFAGTVFQNVRGGRPDASDDEVYSAMARAGAAQIDCALAVGDGAGELSGGQKQRLALARTILSGAPIWVLDEPTSALDADTERIVIGALERERANRLIIISTHRQSLLDMADALLDLDRKGGAAR